MSDAGVCAYPATPTQSEKSPSIAREGLGGVSEKRRGEIKRIADSNGTRNSFHRARRVSVRARRLPNPFVNPEPFVRPFVIPLRARSKPFARPFVTPVVRPRVPFTMPFVVARPFVRPLGTMPFTRPVAVPFTRPGEVPFTRPGAAPFTRPEGRTPFVTPGAAGRAAGGALTLPAVAPLPCSDSR